jgi:hypothetical protein
MPDERVFCSTIVATLGNPHLLLRCVDSIESAGEVSREVPTEAIVILQGRVDHQFARHLRGRIRLERIERKGLSLAGTGALG